MLSEDEISRSDDILASVLLDEEVSQQIDMDDDTRKLLTMSHDTLCWVLGHPGGKNLSSFVESLDMALREKGFELKRITN